MWSTRWTEPPPAPTGESERHAALRQLEQASRGQTYLSAEALLQQHVERYLDKLESFRRGLPRQDPVMPMDAGDRAVSG
jgi:hypothetical protein